jgi:hypothetical protein
MRSFRVASVESRWGLAKKYSNCTADIPFIATASSPGYILMKYVTCVHSPILTFKKGTFPEMPWIDPRNQSLHH